MTTKLFIIKQRGRDLYWNCSAEHGSGWADGNPKQSFSPSELMKEIRRLIDEKWFTDIEVLELIIRSDGPQCEDMTGVKGMTPMRERRRCPNCGERID
jgi:hypothetical protein